MRFLLVLLLAAGTFSATAQNVVKGTNVDGLLVQACLDHGGFLGSDAKISYVLLTTNDQPTFVFYPKPEYYCRMQLLDKNGIEVPPTKLGKSFGAKFSELKGFSYDKVHKHPGNGSNPPGPKSDYLRSDAGQGREFPSPNELFKITNAGNYTLRLQLQLFRRIQPGANQINNFVHKLVTLPPLDIPVVRQ
ncbi:MAG: hypothetical protein JWR26_4464 [Pedosphaera sp.]|nr:hypothetical protein [Pedosphaera sp.]